MKKSLLIAAFGVAGLMSAKTNVLPTVKFEVKKIEVRQIQSEVKVLGFQTSGGLVYSWTSTCGKSHRTTFPSNYSAQQIANYISDANKAECGVRPSNVIVELAPSML